MERATASSEPRRHGAAPLVGGFQNTRAQIMGSPSSLILTHQHVDVLLLREEGTHFLHISAKDGLDQGRLQGEPAFRVRAGSEPGERDTRFGGASLEGLRSGVLAAGVSRGVSAGSQTPKDTGSVEGSATWGGAGAAGVPGSGPA